MDNRYTGVFEQVGDWWIGHVEELRWPFRLSEAETSAVPRHAEIVDPVAIRICKDLGIPRPGE